MQPSALRGRGPLRKHLGSSLRAMELAMPAEQKILYADMRREPRLILQFPVTRASKPLARVRDNIPQSGGGMASSLWGVV